MRCLALTLLAFTAACNGPAPGFDALRSEEVSVGNHRFLVHLGETRAQVVRLNRISLGQTKEAIRAAKEAARQVSGCRVDKVLPGSDQVLMKLSLLCP